MTELVQNQHFSKFSMKLKLVYDVNLNKRRLNEKHNFVLQLDHIIKRPATNLVPRVFQLNLS